jgi:nucleoside-diphosphate-sugar epimerase
MTGGARVTMSDRASVLVVGASGRVGRTVVTELLRLGRPVRALVRRPPPTAFPAGVEVIIADLTDPDSLKPALAGVEAVFLVWAAGPATVSDVVARLARSVSRVVFLSSPHPTPHPFFRQPNPMTRSRAASSKRSAPGGSHARVTARRPSSPSASRSSRGADRFRGRDTTCENEHRPLPF